MERNLWNRSVSSEIGHEKLLTLPHLLQMVCVLLRRFPKELVPLVILEPHTTTLKHVGSWKLGAKDQGSRLLSLHIIAHRFIITEGQMFRTSASGRTTWKIHSSMYDQTFHRQDCQPILIWFRKPGWFHIRKSLQCLKLSSPFKSSSTWPTCSCRSCSAPQIWSSPCSWPSSSSWDP